MIEREKLEEILKNNGKIYHIIEYKGELATVKNKAEDYNAIDLLYLFINGDKNQWFETKQDAEFALKYQNITRTETLSLPTWEEVENDYIEPNIILFHRFMKKDNTEAELVVDCFENKIEVLGVGGAYNIWEATKENYLKACEICRKLFLGEGEIK